MYLKKGIKIVTLLITFGSLFIFFYISLNKKKEFEPKVMIGKEFPTLSSKSLFDDKIIKIEKGTSDKIFLVNIFASWCLPCKIEHPFLMKLKNRNIKIIGINYKDTKKNAKKFLEKNKNPYQKILIDRKGELSINLGAYGVPETYLVDKNFKIIDKHIGPINDQIVAKVLSLR